MLVVPRSAMLLALLQLWSCSTEGRRLAVGMTSPVAQVACYPTCRLSLPVYLQACRLAYSSRAVDRILVPRGVVLSAQ